MSRPASQTTTATPPSSTVSTGTKSRSVFTIDDDIPFSETEAGHTTTNDQESLTYPPLTTPWTTPLSCTWTYNMDQDTQGGAIAFLDIEPTFDATTLSCYPESLIFFQSLQGRTGIYSPATCPRGWTTVSVHKNTNQPEEWATTTAVCCSSEYSLDGAYCKRNMPTAIAIPVTYNLTAGTYELFEDQTSTLTSATIAVHTIRALFREQDKELLALTDVPELDDEDHEGGMSLPERIGLGVGVSVVGLLAVGLLTFCLWRRHRRKAKGRQRTSHELGRIDRSARVREARRGSSECEPPPTYDVATETNSVADAEGSVATSRDEEIRALKAQQVAIQRRIEELEGVDPGSRL